MFLNSVSRLVRPTRGVRFCSTGVDAQYLNTIIVSRKGPIGYITLNRPKNLNALNLEVQNELISSLKQFDADSTIKCVIITGSGDKAFAAGADIKEMAPLNYMDVYNKNMFSGWDEFKKVRVPIIAAVNGFALGGGCELAMYCDMIIASDKAKFGQPEIALGTIPGMGGTQRLTRAVGKSKAMEWILTGDHFDAHTAERVGLVSRVVPHEQLMAEAEKTANKIAAKSRPITLLAKECVNKAYEGTLEEGVVFERRVFHSTFATKDKIEGMSAFVEKRPPNWQDE